MKSDSEIIREAVGRPLLFAEIYSRHAVAVYRYAFRRVGAAVADDVMSETFLVAFQRRAQFDLAVTDARPWLLGIATILIKRHARSEAKHWRLLASLPPEEVVPPALVDERVDAQRQLEALTGALRRMPAKDRDVLLLYAFADLDYLGVAHALGVPIGTVRSRLNRARRTLRRAAGSSTQQEGIDHGRTDTAPFRL